MLGQPRADVPEEACFDRRIAKEVFLGRGHLAPGCHEPRVDHGAAYNRLRNEAWGRRQRGLNCVFLGFFWWGGRGSLHDPHLAGHFASSRVARATLQRAGMITADEQVVGTDEDAKHAARAARLLAAREELALEAQRCVRACLCGACGAAVV